MSDRPPSARAPLPLRAWKWWCASPSGWRLFVGGWGFFFALIATSVVAKSLPTWAAIVLLGSVVLAGFLVMIAPTLEVGKP